MILATYPVFRYLVSQVSCPFFVCLFSFIIFLFFFCNSGLNVTSLYKIPFASSTYHLTTIYLCIKIL
jgi:lipopolysaccharide export LptBFGC system permease protein LptF